MLKRYKLVSIIYGGTGAKYAHEMNSLILRHSEEERYPITSKIVMESILTGDLLASVTDLFTQTEYCIAFLTADDCCLQSEKNTYRIRQNVIFELGMAIYRLGKEHCIFLSDFNPKRSDIELPSDLKDISIKQFSDDNKEEVFNDVLRKILKLSSKENNGVIPHYNDLLDRDEYYVDYSDLFTSCSNLDSRGGEMYLKSVLDFWLEECSSFRHYEERALYFLERTGFVPMFGKNDWVYDWLKKIKKITGHYEKQDIINCSKKKVSFIHNLVGVVQECLILKLLKDQPDSDDYQSLINMLLAEHADTRGVKNPLAMTVYYDYLGLLHLHLYQLKKSESALNDAIRYFTVVLEEYADRTDLGLKIWVGFVSYNLARCYLLRYRQSREEDDAKSAQSYLSLANIIRKSWVNHDEFGLVIRSALSYEYFISKIEEINSYSLFETKTREEIVQRYRILAMELDGYIMKDEQLERLVFVQSLIQQRLNEYISEAPLSENLL